MSEAIYVRGALPASCQTIYLKLESAGVDAASGRAWRWAVFCLRPAQPSWLLCLVIYQLPWQVLDLHARR